MNEQNESANQTNAAPPMDKLWQDNSSADRGLSEPSLLIDVVGFEGPLDLLLHLARTQKVDLGKISVLDLVEQYLLFIDNAREIRLELAADYLVMAAWLAFLKSRLLLPKQAKDDGPSGEELAQTLAFRLKRLEAMRKVAGELFNRDRLGRDFFARGAPQILPHGNKSHYDASLYDVLMAYAGLRQRNNVSQVTIARRVVWSLADARLILARLVGSITEWTSLDDYLIGFMSRPEDRATAIASSFAASLEMVREGRMEMRQDKPFSSIYLRAGPNPLTADELEALEVGNG